MGRGMRWKPYQRDSAVAYTFGVFPTIELLQQQPGQVRELRASIAKPHKRLFFCGEHTAIGSRGMEGALESAERVSLEVLASA